MSALALVQISQDDFSFIYEHLVSHKKGRYRNMHMREACVRNGERDLRYLHVMYAHSNQEIEGMISGPTIFYHYKIKKTAGRIQMTVQSEVGSEREKKRLFERFRSEIFQRITLEKRNEDHHPRRSEGQLYLKRATPGTDFTHTTCQQALATKVLHSDFLKKLSAWNFQLMYGRASRGRRGLPS